MAQHKTRFTVWMEPDTLQAAKARAVQDGVTVSEVLAAAAKRTLIDNDRQHTDAQLLAAMERVFNLIQRTDRRRVYDQQVLKEMVGLLIRSFFNHIPAVPPKEKEAALMSGKVRFNRWLDILARNLRSGQSVLNDLPVPEQAERNEPIVAQPQPSISPLPIAPTTPAVAPVVAPMLPSAQDVVAAIKLTAPPPAPNRTQPGSAEPNKGEVLRELPKPEGHRKKWSLFQ
jgi:hypothetical protein